MDMLQPHQRRVVEEQEELDAKLSKLRQFVVSDKFKTVDEDERLMLRYQLMIMQEYSNVLGERIEAFNP